MTKNEVSVVFSDLPTSINAFVVRTYEDDEHYTIVINSRVSADKQMEAYRHEISHICNDDFASDDAEIAVAIAAALAKSRS